MKRGEFVAVAAVALSLPACPSFERIECRTAADCEGAGEVCDEATKTCGGDGGGGGGPGTGRFPDSPSSYCTDGSAEVDPCPAAGDAGYGQDGSYVIDPPVYDRTGDVVRETVTGLVWQGASSQDETTWDDARQRCESLALDGRTWRLPSRLELVSLLDAGGTAPFSGVREGPHWASSLAASGHAWTVNFLNHAVNAVPPSERSIVLCVSGEPLAGTREPRGEVLVDHATGFTWQRTPSEDAVRWLDALARCEALTLDGSDAWRLPSAKELLTLVDESQLAPEGIELGADEVYWTSSPESEIRAHTVRFPDGYVGADDTAIRWGFVCVR